jgi:hypothetical protein
MSTNEASRRLLATVTDSNGNPLPGTPGGPLPGNSLLITRVAARGPLPTLAVLLVPARPNRTGMLIQNLDDVNTIWYSDNPNVTDQTGATLEAKNNVPIAHAGPLYIYATAGAPVAEVIETLST